MYPKRITNNPSPYPIPLLLPDLKAHSASGVITTAILVLVSSAIRTTPGGRSESKDILSETKTANSKARTLALHQLTAAASRIRFAIDIVLVKATQCVGDIQNSSDPTLESVH